LSGFFPLAALLSTDRTTPTLYCDVSGMARWNREGLVGVLAEGLSVVGGGAGQQYCSFGVVVAGCGYCSLYIVWLVLVVTCHGAKVSFLYVQV
jgi:hypothetical protein